MNITPIQADFSVGEVSRDAQYRSTLDARNRGVKTLTNFVTDARGPVSRRKGFRFLGKIGEPDESLVLTQIYWTGTGTKVYASAGNHENYQEVFDFETRDVIWINDNGLGQLAAIAGGDKCTVTTDITSWPIIDIPAAAQVSTSDGNFLWSPILEKWLLIRPNLNQLGIIVYSTADFVDWTLEFQQTTGPLARHSCSDDAGNIFVAANDGSTGTGYYSVWAGQVLSFVLKTWDPIINAGFLNSEVDDIGSKWVVVGSRQQKWFSSTNSGDFSLTARSSISTDRVEFVKWGEDKFVLRQNRTPWMMYSTDGISWIGVTNNGEPFTDIGTVSGHSISFHPTARWVAVSGVHQWISDDGITWERGPDDGALNSFAWGVLDYPGIA